MHDLPDQRNGRREADPLPGSIPLVTIKRLYRYVQALQGMQATGAASVSSELLAATVGVKASQLRKDLAYFGEFGTRGKGYDLANLLERLSDLLGLTRDWPTVLLGIGLIGTAFARYAGLPEQGFALKGLFDVNPELIGTTVAGHWVHPLDDLEKFCRQERIAIGILTVPASVAQESADRLVAAGVRAILNVAPVSLQLPPTVSVRNVDITVELRLLSYMLIAQGEAGVRAALPSHEGEN